MPSRNLRQVVAPLPAFMPEDDAERGKDLHLLGPQLLPACSDGLAAMNSSAHFFLPSDLEQTRDQCAGSGDHVVFPS